MQPIPMLYPDNGPRELSPREIEAIERQAITVRYPDDWTPQMVVACCEEIAGGPGTG